MPPALRIGTGRKRLRSIFRTSLESLKGMVWVHFSNFVSMFTGREELYRKVHFALKRANMLLAPESREFYVRKGRVFDIKIPNTKLASQSLDVEG